MRSFFTKLGHFFQNVGKGLYRAEPTIVAIVEKVDPRDANKLAMAQAVIVAAKGASS